MARGDPSSDGANGSRGQGVNVIRRWQVDQGVSGIGCCPVEDGINFSLIV